MRFSFGICFAIWPYGLQRFLVLFSDRKSQSDLPQIIEWSSKQESTSNAWPCTESAESNSASSNRPSKNKKSENNNKSPNKKAPSSGRLLQKALQRNKGKQSSVNTTKSKKRKGEEPSDKSVLLGSLCLAEKRRKMGDHGEGEGGVDIVQDEHSYNQPGKCSK